MFKKILLLAAFVFVIVVQPAIAKDTGNSIQIKGSDTMVNLVQAWVEAFVAENPDAFVSVTGGGSGTGIASLINASCDIAASSREMKPKEINMAKQTGIEPQEIKVALDGLVVAVNPKNPVSILTIEQLSNIFTGKIANWKEIGGLDSRIVILSREVNSGTYVYFKEHILRRGDENSREEFSPQALLLPSSQAIADEIAQNPQAVGYFGMGYLNPKHKSIAVSKDNSSEPVLPTIDNVISNRYPISRPLFFYTAHNPTGIVKDFIDFILSDEGQSIVRNADFVPIKQ